MQESAGSSTRPRGPLPRVFHLCALLVAFVGFALPSVANPKNGKVILEGFWWDCLNRRYQTDADGTGGWYTYLAKLSPRLRDMGFDGVWVPPPSKAANGRNGMGYDLFDHYDLGQKFQKNTTGTRFGNQDEFLRMIAVAHACGLEIYADIVLNHVTGGEIDPDAPECEPKEYCKFKTFRYRGFAGAETGRWPKSWLDFHPNPHHAFVDDDWRHVLVCPDICFHGRCCDTDCEHAGTYMIDNARDWLTWFKKQTDVDGFRFDAVKHFPAEVVEAVLGKAMWGSEPQDYFAVGEYVVGKSEGVLIDNWANGTGNRCGTFDFAFRAALHELTYAHGYFDMGSLPNFQQGNRVRTVPFVNNHDTFRGVYSDSSGNGKSDHSGKPQDKNTDELVATIDPDDPWATIAYAAAFAVDGSPQVYYEDLFTNNIPQLRERADPKNLPTRPYVENLIWCHQKLNFKDGAYKVRFRSSSDLLVIERSGKAVIALNDNGSGAVPDDPLLVATDFGPNVCLHDYSGSIQGDVHTDALGRLAIKVPPKSYCVWAPAGISGGFSGHPRRTTQEFQMSDDLGDSQPESLGYGGNLVASTFRTAGAVWVKDGAVMRVSIYADQPRLVILRALAPTIQGAKSDRPAAPEAQGTATASAPFTCEIPTRQEGYYQLTAKLANNDDTPVRAYIKVEYEAPAESNLF